ncbi:MAG: hypothetical protein K9H64_11275 [Bacteroidales bacterium]|nr:hypothetical protein [Bacteroidales bacterium]MCF8456532.1 hypothetical protein [Bacteroidales bacterium]
MKLIKLLVSFFLLNTISYISSSQIETKVDSFSFYLNSNCSENPRIRYWNEEFTIFDYNNGVIFIYERPDTISTIINYKRYSDSLNQSPAKFGVILKNDSIGLIDLNATEISYFSNDGKFGSRIFFEETSGRFGTFIDARSLFKYQNQYLKNPVFLPLNMYQNFPNWSGRFGRGYTKYYSKRRLIGRYNYNGKLVDSFGYYDDIYMNIKFLSYIDDVSFFVDYQNNRVFVGQEASPIIQVYDFNGKLITKFGDTPSIISDWQYKRISNIKQFQFFELSYRIESPIYTSILYEPLNNLIFRKCLLPSIDTTKTEIDDKIYKELNTSCGFVDPKTVSRQLIYSDKPILLQIYNSSFELIKEYHLKAEFSIIGFDDKYVYVSKGYRPETHSILILKYLTSDFLK